MKKLLIAVMLLLCALPAQARTIDLTYDISFLGLPVGEIHYQIVLNGDAYTLTFDGGFGGLVGVVADADGKATASGVIRGGKVIPKRLDQTVLWGEKERKIFIAFDAKGNVADYNATPHYSTEGRALITPDMLTDVRDALSGMIHAVPANLNDFCSQTVRVFDVRERYDLQFTPAGEMRCTVTPVQVGGYKLDDADAKNPPRPFKMTFKIVGDGKLAVPYKTVKPFTLGSATIKLSKVTEY